MTNNMLNEVALLDRAVSSPHGIAIRCTNSNQARDRLQHVIRHEKGQGNGFGYDKLQVRRRSSEEIWITHLDKTKALTYEALELD